MFDIVELQHELTQNRIERGLERDTVVARTARTLQRKKDVKTLYAEGYDAREISIIAHIPLATVQNTIAEIEKDKAEAREFLATGQMPSEGGYLAIFT